MTPNRSSSKGFTLVEIIIVASLITILSSIISINYRTWLTSNKRKSAIGDLRTLAHTVANAHFDLQMFPKFCYLYEPRETIGLVSLPLDFEAMGHPQIDGTVLFLRQRSIMKKWKGPYYNSPASRSTLTPGLGYVTKMQLPGGQKLDWPADPWGNPYVIYLVKIDASAEIDFISNPFEKPNYKAIVVSYGPNRIPGGTADKSKMLPADQVRALEYRLADARRYAARDNLNRATGGIARIGHLRQVVDHLLRDLGVAAVQVVRSVVFL